MEFFKNNLIQLETCGKGMTRKILAYNNDLMVVEVNFETNAVGAMHTHPHSQITYCQSGKFIYMIEDRKYELNPGDSVYVKGDEIHGITCLEKGIALDIFTPCRKDFIKETK